MAGQYIVSHDVGTAGSKAVLVDSEGRILHSSFEGYGGSVSAPTVG